VGQNVAVEQHVGTGLAVEELHRPIEEIRLHVARIRELFRRL
jgi:hypothetical protein